MRRLVCALGLGAALGCGTPPGSDPCLQIAAAPAMDGNVTDETWLTFKDSESRATDDPSGSPEFTTPTADLTFPASGDAPTFAWTSPLKIASNLELPRAGTRLVAPDAIDRAIESLSAALIPAARAHLPPKTGDMYLIEMPLAGRQCPLGLHSSNLQMTLDSAGWKELKTHAGEDITATIVGAYLVQNRVSEGPYKGTPITFHVE